MELFAVWGDCAGRRGRRIVRVRGDGLCVASGVCSLGFCSVGR